MHKASKRNFFLTTKWKSRKTKFRHDFIWNWTERTLCFVVNTKKINNIVNILLTLLSATATETETEIKSPVGSWTLSQGSVQTVREKGMFWTSLLTDCPIMSHEIFNTETEKQHTHETTQLTTGKRETAKQLRNMADNSPNPNPNPKPNP